MAGIVYHMYITETPCGDSSFIYNESSVYWTGAKKIDKETDCKEVGIT